MTIQETKIDQRFSSFAGFWAGAAWSPFVKKLHLSKDRPHTLAVLEQQASSFLIRRCPNFTSNS